jgi:hypothetical protein
MSATEDLMKLLKNVRALGGKPTRICVGPGVREQLLAECVWMKDPGAIIRSFMGLPIIEHPEVDPFVAFVL